VLVAASVPSYISEDVDASGTGSCTTGFTTTGLTNGSLASSRSFCCFSSSSDVLSPFCFC
jgi:hypothetical protein